MSFKNPGQSHFGLWFTKVGAADFTKKRKRGREEGEKRGEEGRRKKKKGEKKKREGEKGRKGGFALRTEVTFFLPCAAVHLFSLVDDIGWMQVVATGSLCEVVGAVPCFSSSLNGVKHRRLVSHSVL